MLRTLNILDMPHPLIAYQVGLSSNFKFKCVTTLWRKTLFPALSFNMHTHVHTYTQTHKCDPVIKKGCKKKEKKKKQSLLQSEVLLSWTWIQVTLPCLISGMSPSHSVPRVTSAKQRAAAHVREPWATFIPGVTDTRSSCQPQTLWGQGKMIPGESYKNTGNTEISDTECKTVWVEVPTFHAPSTEFIVTPFPAFRSTLICPFLGNKSPGNLPTAVLTVPQLPYNSLCPSHPPPGTCSTQKVSWWEPSERALALELWDWDPWSRRAI